MKYLRKFNESIETQIDNDTLQFVEDEFIYLSDILDNTIFAKCDSNERIDGIGIRTLFTISFVLREDDFVDLENAINKIMSLPNSDRFRFRFGNEYARVTFDYNEWKDEVLELTNSYDGDDSEIPETEIINPHEDYVNTHLANKMVIGIPRIGERAWITFSLLRD